MQAPRVLFLTGDETGSSMWRVWSVCKALQERGYVAEWSHKDQADKALPLVALGMFDAIITPRIVWPIEGIGDRWIATIHKAGCAWIYECDDDVWSAPIVGRQTQLFESERKKGPAQLEWERNERIRLLQQCDGVTVSSRRLKTICQRFTADARWDVPVKVVPNAIDVHWFRRTLRGCARLPELEGHVTIGWAGGTREDLDLLPLIEAWRRLAPRHPDVRFVMQGHLSEALIDAIPPGQILTLPWLDLAEYPRALLNVDIGCCIVSPRVFNTAKTPIKWWEFSLAGAACVVSPTLYGPDVTPEVDALVAESADEWEAQLERLIIDAELRKRINKEARRTVVTHHSLENNWQKWLIAWAEIIEQYQARQARQLVLPR